ncbi:class II fructose-1,6-bisphosphate aldolase [Candidatus Woesearchaeota archaeon]|nr:class II fructose-1,6-bisphosphate aldolase [Candidatus Woesearchaeota archaeon]
MSLVTLKSLLYKSNKNNYAVGAFNVNNMEVLEAVIRAAESRKSPVIIQTSEGAISYAGLKILFSMIKTAVENSKIPAAIHLDHGRNLALIKKCISIGYTSIMIDASHFEFKENIKQTKKVVSLCEKKGISVEAELGTIGGAEESVVARKIIYTDPSAAKEFVDRTGIDALAIAIGTSHGAFKFAGRQELDISRLKQIKKLVKIPLVLHGASCVPLWLVSRANKFGAKISGAEGVPDSQVALAVKNGINKVNTDTDLRLAFTESVRETLAKNKKEFDPRKILGPARDTIQKIVEHRMKLFGSAGKA